MPNFWLSFRVIIIYKKLFRRIINKLLIFKINIRKYRRIDKSIMLNNRQRNISNKNSSKQTGCFWFNTIKIHIFQHFCQINSLEIFSIYRQYQCFRIGYFLLNIISCIPVNIAFYILIQIFINKNSNQISSIGRVFSKNSSYIDKKPTLKKVG